MSKGRQQHPISPLLPVNRNKFFEEVLTQMPSPALTGSFRLGRQTWSVHSLTGILAFSLCFLAGLWPQPGKLTFLSGRKITEENAFEIPSLLNQRYIIVVSNCKTVHCLHYISYSYFFHFFTLVIKYICLQKDNEPHLSHFLSSKSGIVQLY